MPDVPLTMMDDADPELLAELLTAVEEVARSGQFIGGRYVERFEQAFAEWCETPDAIGVSSGTDALTLTLRALGVRRGDKVIVPANSFIATAEGVSLAGAEPVFADVDPETQVVTAETLRRAHVPGVCGIIPVHLFGRTVAMDDVMDLARQWNAWVVEDCAQAHGARYAGRRVGGFGAAGTFSFYPAKNLGAWGDGGAVVTGDATLARRLRMLRSHGEEPRYHHHVVGTTARLDAVQAAVLERKLERLEVWTDARRAHAAVLFDALSKSDQVQPPPAPQPPTDHVYHQFVVRTSARAELREHLSARGIATAVHYPVPIHRSPAYLQVDAPDVAPVASQLAGEICSLPIFPAMTREQLDQVARAVLEFEPAGPATGRSAPRTRSLARSQ